MNGWIYHDQQSISHIRIWYDNTKERKQTMKTIVSDYFKNYPYRTISLHSVEEVELIENVCDSVFNEQFVMDTMYFDFVEMEVCFPESATWIIIQALQERPDDGFLIHKCINAMRGDTNDR